MSYVRGSYFLHSRSGLSITKIAYRQLCLYMTRNAVQIQQIYFRCEHIKEYYTTIITTTITLWYYHNSVIYKHIIFQICCYFINCIIVLYIIEIFNIAYFLFQSSNRYVFNQPLCSFILATYTNMIKIMFSEQCIWYYFDQAGEELCTKYFAKKI